MVPIQIGGMIFGKHPLLQGPRHGQTHTIQLKLTRGPFHYNSEVGFSEFLAGYAVSSAP